MYYGEKRVENPIRWGMVGGGRGSQIGYIHRSAALRDFNFELVAGAFDIDPERGKDFGKQLHVDPDRCYPDYKTMFAEEAKRPDGVQAVSIATPNGMHYEVCKADLGEIRVINMSFAFGGYNFKIEDKVPSAKWRFDPSKEGPSFALGDVGTHPLFIIEAMIPDMKIDNLMCTKRSFVEGRELEDNAFVIMNLKGSENVQAGAQVYCWASSINSGARHYHKIRVVGSKASLEWDDERPNQMLYEIEGEPSRVLERGAGYLTDEARVEDRIGGGHAEGLFEAWSNLYARFAVAMAEADKGAYGDFWYPDVKAGAQGIKWIEKCVESADKGSAWVDYE